jgi:acyl-CoA synthetase (NDP forming)
VDFVVVAVPFQSVPEVMKDCVQAGVKAALIISAGLAETGAEGAKFQREIVDIARTGGMRLTGPNCMGNFNTSTNFSTLRQGLTIGKGEIGLISQSGGFAWHILQCGTEMGVGFSKFVSTGNEADLHLEDFLEYLGQDEETKVITAYVEGLREGKRFFRLAKDITKRKPIVVMKVGRTKAGAKATQSHTAAIAGTDIVYDTMFKQAGVIRVDEVEELFDVAAALLRQPLPKGRKVGILTSGGGFGCVITDACERSGLEVASLSPSTIERLNAVLPPRWPHGNPVDTVAAGFVTYPCLWPLMEDDNLDALIVVNSVADPAGRREWLGNIPPSMREEADKTYKAQEEEELKELDMAFAYMNKYQKPLIICRAHTPGIKNSRTFKKLQDNGILMYPTPERAAKVLAHLTEYSEYLSHC